MPISITEGDTKFTLNKNTLYVTWMDCGVLTLTRDEWLRVVEFFHAVQAVESANPHPTPNSKASGA